MLARSHGGRMHEIVLTEGASYPYLSFIPTLLSLLSYFFYAAIVRKSCCCLMIVNWSNLRELICHFWLSTPNSLSFRDCITNMNNAYKSMPGGQFLQE